VYVHTYVRARGRKERRGKIIINMERREKKRIMGGREKNGRVVS
jgi:hypothetical protein